MDYQKPSYHKELDGLRGLAVLLVILSHAQLLHFGWMGVQLFFILSGYLITRILLYERQKPISLKNKFSNFWGRRVLRIFPLYYLYLLLLLIVCLVFDKSPNFIKQLPFLITYTYNFSILNPAWKADLPITHLWSLSVEEQFYLLYPFLIFLCKEKQLRIAAIFLILFSSFFRLLLNLYLPSAGFDHARTGGIIYSLTFSHFDAFLLGGSISIFNLNGLSLKFKTLAFVITAVIAVTGGLFIYTQIFTGPFDFNNYITHLGYTPDYIGWGFPVWSYLILNVLFASLLLLLISPVKKNLSLWLSKLFSLRMMTAIGKISYGMYILHLAIYTLVLKALSAMNFAMNKYLVFIVFAPILYFVALFIYSVYEKKFLALKDKFR
jgi:peptidoglycan/LPS O-acetylase OafA/YrhL